MPSSFRFVLELPGGLHARPATLLAELAASTRATLTLVNERSGIRCDCRSVLALMASDSRSGDRCQIEASGPGTKAALAAVRKLVTTEWQATREARLPEAPAAGFRLPYGLRDREGMVVATGPIVSPGLAVGPLIRAGMGPTAAAARPLPEFAGVEREQERFLAARNELANEIATQMKGPAGQDILAAQRAMVLDPEFSRQVLATIGSERLPAHAALARAGEPFRQSLASSASEYLRARVADLDEISGRLAAILNGDIASRRELSLPSPAILAATRLTPGELLRLDPQKLLGLILAETAPTSHTAILARSLGIPCLVAQVPRDWPDGGEIVLDSRRGFAMPVCDERDRRYIAVEQQARLRHQRSLAASASLPGSTADGVALAVGANVASAIETRAALEAGADGVGLFRTEMLFLGRDTPPGEEEQTRLYTSVLELAGDRPVIVRTADIGGDKPLPWLEMAAEDNPFLGCRGIRLYEKYPGLRDTQLRALLRAGGLGPRWIMFPMVSTVEEVRKLRQRIGESQAELVAGGGDPVATPVLGVMLEVPALAFQIAELAGEIDFISIGSNDLLQYFLAADRGQPSLQGLYRPCQPSFLRFLRFIAGQAKVVARPVRRDGRRFAPAAASGGAGARRDQPGRPPGHRG